MLPTRLRRAQRPRFSLPLLLLLLTLLPACEGGGAGSADQARWEARAANVTIVRDEWGIPHVYGVTDADVVFGVIYAHAEDDFNRIETNYLNAMGRLAEAEGETAIWRDLRMKLFIDPTALQELHAEAPEWLRELTGAWADGLNYYLASNPDVTPRVITRFEPWMALAFSEGSIGGDIERVSLRELEAFYQGDAGIALPPAPVEVDTGIPPEPTGSNGFAIAPSRSESGNALLLINPHTSFFFRGEARMASEEGLNAYGAITWGQFFIYQGFNDRLGWMHTSSSADNIDEFIEVVEERDGGYVYRYGEEERPVEERTVRVPYRAEDGTMAEREFTVYRTHHGPVVRAADGRWTSVALMQDPVNALTQSWLRTKARSRDEFRQVMELRANSSNNTIYADADGNISYFHVNFMPRRDPGVDHTRPVDGSDPATDWQGLHPIDELPEVLNPSTGWIQNTNNWPWSAAGPASPRQVDFPSYVDRGTENARGIHAMRVLEARPTFTLETLIEAAYDSQLPAFEPILPPLFRAFDRLATGDPLRVRLAEPIAELRGWDIRFSAESVPTTLAIYWGEELLRTAGADPRRSGVPTLGYMAGAAPDSLRLAALETALARLEGEWGSWRTPWGEINRFQRLTGAVASVFDDEQPSLPVPFASGRWGSLASFGANFFQGSRRMYGGSGNSFVAVVEFGDSIRARAIMAGGQSGDPASPHFLDQAEMYSRGEFREVPFYRSQLEGKVQREYRPGR